MCVCERERERERGREREVEITLRGAEFQLKGSFIWIYLPSTDSLNEPEFKSFHKSLLSAFISSWIQGERMIRGHRSGLGCPSPPVSHMILSESLHSAGPQFPTC